MHQDDVEVKEEPKDEVEVKEEPYDDVEVKEEPHDDDDGDVELEEPTADDQEFWYQVHVWTFCEDLLRQVAVVLKPF